MVDFDSKFNVDKQNVPQEVKKNKNFVRKNKYYDNPKNFSTTYFGKLITGLDGANAYQYSRTGAFGVVIKTDSSDPPSDLLVAFPSPYYLETSWVNRKRFRFATKEEIEKIIHASSENPSNFKTGDLVETTDGWEVDTRRGTYYIPTGIIGVIDHEDDPINPRVEVEFGKKVIYTKQYVILPDGRKISNFQLVNAATSRRMVSVILQDYNLRVDLPEDILIHRLPNPEALKKVVASPKIKEKLLEGTKLLDPEFRKELEEEWNLKSFSYGRGFIALIYGKPGTGKTTLVRALADQIGRPIFRIEGSDLGTDPEEFTSLLDRAMRRALRLNAILLIEEADQILQRRTLNMYPSVLAKISEVLQKIENFEGVLLLTSNRAFTLDDAARSRLNLIYEMPPLTADLRESILLTSLPKELPIEGVLPIAQIAALDLDGRAIKMAILNAARRAKANGKSKLPAQYIYEEAKLLLEGLEGLRDSVREANFFLEEEE
ncbi:MAG: AAA family ATPase [bacterium]|nr:AAA family ATPase [bacterium]